jgi:hypothetical protein
MSKTLTVVLVLALIATTSYGALFESQNKANKFAGLKAIQNVFSFWLKINIIID